MNLQNILYKVSIDIVNGLFVAINGTISDGHQFIEKTIEKVAIAIIVEQIPANINEDITYIKVEKSYDALGIIAGNFYNNPSDRIKLVGVTGTNGKTTIVSLLHQLFGFLNVKVGMLSTIQNKIIEQVIPSTLTTPDALHINFLLSKMLEKGCEYCFMEVSSHAISQGRVNGLNFASKKNGSFLSIRHGSFMNQVLQYSFCLCCI